MSIFIPLRGKFEDSYWDIISNGFPITLSIIVEIVILIVNISYASSDDEKSALGVTWALIHSFGGSLILGFNYGYATFASRAFGAVNKHKFKLFFVQGLKNLGGLLGLLIVVSLFAYKICLSLGQQYQIAVISQKLILGTLPGHICLYFAHYIRVFLNCQDVYKPNMIVDASSIIIHIIVCKILSSFITGQYLPIVATNITYVLYCIGSILVERFYARWKISKQIFNVQDANQQYRQFFLQCCYIGIPISLDFFVLEFMTLFVGAFQNTPETTSHVIVTTIYMTISSVYIGFSFFMVIRIGNLVGQNNPNQIKILLVKVFKSSAFFICLMYVIIYVFQDNIIQFYYSKEEQITTYTYPVINMFCVYFLLDSAQYIGSNFFKPLGFGSWVIKIFCISYYAIGMGSMLILSIFLEKKIMCAWIGNAIACLTQLCIYFKKANQINIQEIVYQLNNKMSNKQGSIIQLKQMDFRGN